MLAIIMEVSKPRWSKALKAVALWMVFLMGIALCFWLIHFNTFHGKYSRIKVGMTIEDAELLLGPAQKIESNYVPQMPPMHAEKLKRNTTAVVDGDEFFQWQSGLEYIVVGVRNGCIVETWYSAPSL